MKQIVIISGKGGTGKTMFTSSLASIVKNKVMVDCDVDAADLHLILKPKVLERNDFYGGKKAHIDNSICSGCGKCYEVCRFDAVSKDFHIDSIACEGCGFCARMCPENAIEMRDAFSGEWFVSDTEYGKMVHAKLGIAEENSGKLVARIRKIAGEMAEADGLDYVIIDGPPGTGCPVIASITATDIAVVVSEPSLSGIHDLMRVADIADHFKIRLGVIINKYDINLKNTLELEAKCRDRSIEIFGRIPFSECVPKAIVKGVPPINFCQEGVGEAIESIWHHIVDTLEDVDKK